MTPSRSVFEKYLGKLLLALLLGCCLLVLRPFFSALLWAAVMAFAIWPLHSRLVRLLRGRRTLATVIAALGMFCVILVPVLLVGASLGDNVKALTAAVQGWMESGPPPPPDWLGKVPGIGPQAVEHWSSLAADSSKLLAAAKPVIEWGSVLVLRSGLTIGAGLLELALSLLIACLLLRDGEKIAGQLGQAVQWIGGERGSRLLAVAGNTIRGVVYGTLGTALAQALLMAVGLLIAGVPGVPLLSMLCFFLAVTPVGCPLIWIPASLWLFAQGSPGSAIFLIIWGVGVGTMDNVLRPWLSSRGNPTPALLIFFGVLGGGAAFGFIGIFIGPTFLAVGYRILEDWAATHRKQAETEAAGSADESAEDSAESPAGAAGG